MFKCVKLQGIYHTYPQLYSMVSFQTFLSLGLPFLNPYVGACVAHQRSIYESGTKLNTSSACFKHLKALIPPAAIMSENMIKIKKLTKK